MRSFALGVCLLVLAACGTSGDPDRAVPNPFPDVVLAELDELGEDGDVTDVVEWKMVIVADRSNGPRAFRRADPNNGCRLTLADEAAASAELHPSAVFYDLCHGNQYDMHGRPLGDSAPRAMQLLPVEVRDGEVVLVRAEERERFERELAAWLDELD